MAKRDTDMTQGTIWRHLLSFSVPMMIGMLFQQLYNTVDMLVVGQFVGEAALAAVGSTASIINMLIGVCNGLSMGAGVVISQAYGAHDNKRLHSAVHTTVTVSFIMCAAVTLIGILIVDPMLTAMDTPENVFPEASAYLKIYFAGVSGLLLYNMGGAILRAVGDSKRPQYFLILSAGLNIVLDLLFVIVFHMGVAGVSLATVIAQLISAVLILCSLSHDHAAYGLRWKELHINRKELKTIFAIGLPSSVQMGLTSFSNVFVQGYINNFGSAAMAGWSCYIKLDAFVMIPMSGFTNAASTFVGQNWGARQPERARKGVWQSVLMSGVATMVLAAIMVLFAPHMVRIFSPEPEVIRFGAYFLQIITPFYFFCSLNSVYGGALRGVGSSAVTMVISLTSYVAFRQLFLFVGTGLGGGLIVVTLAYPVGWVVATVLFVTAYLRCKLFKPLPEIQEKNIAQG